MGDLVLLRGADEPDRSTRCAACGVLGEPSPDGGPPAGWARVTVKAVSRVACSLSCAIQAMDGVAVFAGLPLVPGQK